MMELMSTEALAVGAARRREVALDTMREVKAAAGVRNAAALAIVAIGQRLTREDETRNRAGVDGTLQPCVDCG
jgi:hypothetical protein